MRRRAGARLSPTSINPVGACEWATLSRKLSAQGSATKVHLSQDNNSDEEARAHTAQFWQGMLESLKQLLER